MQAASRPVAGLAVVAALGLALAAAATGRAHPDLALGDARLPALALQVAAATGAVVAGLLVLASVPRARCSGVLLALAGPAAALAMVPGPGTRSGLLFTAALAFGAAAPALVGAAAAAYPVDLPSPRWRWPVAVVLVLGVGVAGVLRAALFSPAAAGCFSCPDNLLDVGAGPGAFSAVDGWTPGLVVAWSVLVLVVVGRRWRSALPAVRRCCFALVAAAAVAGPALAGAVEAVLTAAQPFGPVARGVWLVQCALVLVVCVLVAGEALAVRRVSRRMAERVLREDAEVEAAAVVSGILTSAGELGPSGGEVVFPRAAAVAVDGDGSPATGAEPGVEVVALRRAGEVTTELRYPCALAGAGHRVVAATTAAALALERIGATARLQAELVELAASRIRIMEAADAERRRLERDLHDGAQQRLIALQMLSRLAARGAEADRPATATALDAAADDVSAALADLRRLARGIYPATLTDLDLAAALRSLAGAGGAPLTVSTELAVEPSPVVARTVYQLVARSVEEAGNGPDPDAPGVVASAIQAGRDLRVVVTAELDPVAAGRVDAAVADRVAALGGTLSRGGGDGQPTTFDLVLPCGS